MTFTEACEWLKREGKLSAEEERFFDSVKDETVYIPDER